MARLTRRNDDRMIAGVCGAVAHHFGLETGRVRVATVLGLLFFGSTAVVYLLLWYVLPLDD